MMTNTALIPASSVTTDEVFQIGKVLAQSGYFQDAREAAQCITKILAGRELGIGPVASLTGIYIVKGRVTLSANLMAAQLKRSGKYTYHIRRMDDTGCEIEYFEGQQSIGVSSFTEADAKAAGLLGGENWKKFPRNMYFARAMSNGAKWYCPDVFSGPVYTPDELSSDTVASYTPPMVDVRTGEIVDSPATEQPPAAPPVANSNGQAKKPPTRAGLLKRIAELTEQAVSLELEIELSKPLGEATDAELIDHGKRLKDAVDHAKANGLRTGGVVEESLPTSLPSVG